MIPNNNHSTPKPIPHPSSSSNSSSTPQFQLPLFSQPMAGVTPIPNPNPNPNPYPQQPPQHHPILNPIPDFPQFSNPEEPRDFGVPYATTSVQTHPWVDQETNFQPFSTDFGVSDQDIDIGSIIANFLNPSNSDLFGGPDHGASCNGVADETERGFLKRGTVDYMGVTVPIDVDNATPKRTKTMGEVWNENPDFQFDFSQGFFSPVVEVEEVQGDPRGKRKLDGHGADTSGAAERLVLGGDNGGGGNSGGLRRLSREEKMKGPVMEIDFLANAFHDEAFGAPRPENSNPGVPIEISDDDDDDDDDGGVIIRQPPQDFVSSRRRERFRDIAKENASRFARFVPDAKDESSNPEPPIDEGPTPFSTALKFIREKGMKNVQNKSWVPKWNHTRPRIKVPSLKEICLKVLASYADAIVSLDGVPEDLRHRLSQLTCDSHRMDSHFFELVVKGSPTEIRLRDCSWMSEDQLTESLKACDTSKLEVLQLDQCGRCIPDYIVTKSPRWLHLPRLISLSITGACRLSDKGLRALISSAPALRSVNLSQCSLLTSASINILADSLGPLLKELYLDHCQNIDTALIVPALKALENLEVLSLAGVGTVCDKFIKDYIIANGQNMKELILKDCVKLTDVSIKVIAEHCPLLCVLDLENLPNLTDLSIGYLANNCRALNTLKLPCTPFSDEAIAAFIEIIGESLKELSLNKIKKVGQHTAVSLASHAKNLQVLDLSFCRNLTDTDLGLIVDSCFSLKFLILFGCTQVTDVFLKGYSNPETQIIGLQMSPLLQHVKVPDYHQGALRYSPVPVNSP
ncbi:uncharacterized protein LOC107457829 [Arachis duranensis]|uniref:Uncharacterized protein LOC107457829 n=1 Tax=Arachis duranensis TaxID=130453 RepID=A0A6P4BJK0_ARADU|nr:uncharacterized protein LOC107457829 [Arachis duranensis]